ncbi:MAG: hypothetical protein ABW250_11730 [Pyrinomonadaceae bacterium]
MRLPKKRLTGLLLFANVCLLILNVSGWSLRALPPSHAQGNSKTVVREHPAPREPVEITPPRVNGRETAFSEAFQGGSDWISKLSFKVKNRSKTPITYARIDITFPETTASGPKMLHQIFIGQRADNPSTLNNPPLYLMPKEAMDISLASQIGEIERLVKSRHPSLDAISKIAAGLGEVMFADGTLYSGGALFKRNPDPASPRKWVMVEDEQNTRLGN